MGLRGATFGLEGKQKPLHRILQTDSSLTMFHLSFAVGPISIFVSLLVVLSFDSASKLRPSLLVARVCGGSGWIRTSDQGLMRAAVY